ncbi:MAG: ABC transporter permease [Acetobacteraceae bacterium]|nr:ABC transporter permease [Acetobacteraceae bacterium]
MQRLIAARLVQAAITLGLLSVAAYALIGLMPGDPIDLAIMADPRLSAADARAMRAAFDLDQPLYARYLAWAGRILSGDPGFSRLYSRPVAEVIGPALVSTLVLLGAALLLAAALGVGLGIAAALAPNSLRERVLNLVAFAGSAMPTFWLGILLIALFAVELGWLPAGGAGEGALDGLRYLVLPTATLAFATLPSYLRQTRAALLDALAEPHIRTARAKGASRRRVITHHALPNAAIPVLTIAALDAAGLVSGALVTETVFARPGMGKTIYDAILGNDYNLALVCLLLSAAVALAASLAADLAQRAIDPRLGA